MQCTFYVYVIAIAAHQVHGFIVHTALQSLVFTDVDDSVPDDVHSEYFFGKCKTMHKKLYFQDTKTYDDVKGKIIITGQLESYRDESKPLKGVRPLPRCVYVRARSKYGDLVRFHAFKFNICVGTIIYNYCNEIYDFPFYEWYLPVEAKERITWELFFYY